MPRTVEDAIAAAVARGAMAETRADYWRGYAKTEGNAQAIGWLDKLTGTRSVAAGQPFQLPGLPLPGQVAAAAPPGVNPALYHANPLLDEAQATRPALVKAALEESGPPPELFGDKPLPPFTASGLDPQHLASQPWPIRRPMAAAPTQAEAYKLAEQYSGNPEMSHPDHALGPHNQPYVSDFSNWLSGSGNHPADRPPEPVLHHPGTGQFAPKASAPDYTSEALYAEIFGDQTT